MTRGILARAAAAGCGAGLALTGTMFALRLRLDAPSFPERLDDLVLLLMPRALFGEALDRLGFAAKPLLFVGIVLAQLALATAGGMIYGRVAAALAGRLDLTHPLLGGAAGVFAGVALDFVILPALEVGAPLATPGWPDAAPAVALTVAPGLAYGLALTTLLRLLAPPQRGPADDLVGYVLLPSRGGRRALLALLIPAMGALVTAWSLRRLLAGVPPRQTVAAAPGPPMPPTMAPSNAPTATAAPTVAPSPPPPAASAGSATPVAPIAARGPAAPGDTPPTAPTTSTAPPAATAVPSPTPTPGVGVPAGVALPITPVGEFYTISKNALDPLLAGRRWELAIDGLVGQPRTLRLADLQRLPAVSRPVTLTCIGNEVGGDLIGTAVWTGVPLATLLAEAGLRPAASHLAFVCDDGYTETLPIGRALDPATLLVYEMNGAPLTEPHGYPARLIAPGRYGMKNPKWIVRIGATDRPPVGYWTQRGWSPDEPIQTSARIDVPGFAATIGRGPTMIGGIAFAGDRGIARVEVSADGGAIWRAALLEPALGTATWVRWALPWTPPGPGRYTLVARAYDGAGTPQSADERKAGPGGATGYARREVVVAP